MEVQESLANDIVQEMKKIINKNINYIRTDGKIIASTDPKRVGDYHEGAKRVASSKAMLIIEYDGQYAGTKKGINLPVSFNNEIIGVIGISGEKEEVEKYGQIIKKMTEILIKDSYMQAREEWELEFEKIMLEKLLLGENQIQDTLVLSERLKEFSAQEDGIVLSLSFQQKNKEDFHRWKQILDGIKMITKKNQGYLMSNRSLISILFFRKKREDLERILEKITAMTEEEKEEFHIGIGERKQEILNLKDSYQESMLSLEWAIKVKKSYIFYEDMKLEILVNSLEEKVKENYKKRIFQSLSPEEIEDCRSLLFCYEKNNGSLDRTAKELFIHKNTLQYKIYRLRDKIGLDIRNYHDFSLLKLACFL